MATKGMRKNTLLWLAAGARARQTKICHYLQKPQFSRLDGFHAGAAMSNALDKKLELEHQWTIRVHHACNSVQRPWRE